jgi:MFS family permease
MVIALALGMPFFVLFGWLSDRIGKKIMMAGCLLAALTYIPIYHAMQSAAGNNVVTVKSTHNAVTGAISLTPMTRDATGTLVAAKEAPSPDFNNLVLLVFVQVLYVCMVYGPIAAFLVELFPAKVRYTSLSLPYHTSAMASLEGCCRSLAFPSVRRPATYTLGCNIPSPLP